MVHIGTSPHEYLKDLQISELKFKFPKYLKAIQTINTFEQTTTQVHTNKKKTKQQSPPRGNGLTEHKPSNDQAQNQSI